MSRAFVKETEALDELPERLVSEHRNLVTPEGLALIEGEIKRLQEDLNAARESDDRNAIARASHDLRYWSQRLATAELQPPASDASVVAFGSRVTLERDDGRMQKFRIVGEDEADPAKGSISYVSPLAQALLGKAAGDTVKAGSGEAEIIKIE
ncbi:GreA/GreB family elongation factor [Hyphomicrobium denitrificans ATCC 51888]|uniref:GreA/GreB family elongation factor n=1 Tax=Hyphomicrobium denitrificans (strain ATCC 51888 / DSM 1869 / NCIMB 11706 / TK 0415) TaxID=582899 RepID=D8JZ23_HYPDA|nr:transcription elongation factor GreA [Hyphomicrobium denitrificans]ADJ23625.1 GreA/GreB family elongation factor [Hyphomicrobium denitrificans ATCC 51888]